MKKITLFLFFYLIQFSLSVKEEANKTIRFLWNLGEPECFDDYYKFDYYVLTEGFGPSGTRTFTLTFAEPNYYKYRCSLSDKTNYEIFSCMVWLGDYPLINQKLELKKNISDSFKNLKILDWDAMVGESTILSENATCIGSYSHEFIPNKKKSVKNSCLPDNYNEMKIKGFFKDNTNAYFKI